MTNTPPDPSRSPRRHPLRWLVVVAGCVACLSLFRNPAYPTEAVVTPQPPHLGPVACASAPPPEPTALLYERTSDHTPTKPSEVKTFGPDTILPEGRIDLTPPAAVAAPAAVLPAAPTPGHIGVMT